VVVVDRYYLLSKKVDRGIVKRIAALYENDDTFHSDPFDDKKVNDCPVVVPVWAMAI
jgi:hypothetical protein